MVGPWLSQAHPYTSAHVPQSRPLPGHPARGPLRAGARNRRPLHMVRPPRARSHVRDQALQRSIDVAKARAIAWSSAPSGVVAVATKCRSRCKTKATASRSAACGAGAMRATTTAAVAGIGRTARRRRVSPCCCRRACACAHDRKRRRHGGEGQQRSRDSVRQRRRADHDDRGSGGRHDRQR